MIQTLKALKSSDIGDYMKLLSLKYKDIESRSFREIAILVRREFLVECEDTDVEKHYETDTNNNDNFSEDFELESRRHENNVNF